MQKVNDKLVRHIHFWIGKESSQDEYGIAAYKTVELDESLEGEPTQVRECQDDESNEFQALFKSLKYLTEGAVDSGFKKVDREAFTTRLLHVKGRRNIRVSEVKLEASSFNSGDVFILDAGRTIFQWNGKSASNVERIKALEITGQIKDQERGGKANCIIIDEGKDDDKIFWETVGCSKPSKMKAEGDGGDDEQQERATAEKVSLHRISTSGGKSVTIEFVKKGTDGMRR